MIPALIIMGYAVYAVIRAVFFPGHVAQRTSAAVQFTTIARKALRNYYSDHGAFPPASSGRLSRALIEPVIYIERYRDAVTIELPIDPFDATVPPLHEYSLPERGWDYSFNAAGPALRYNVIRGIAYVSSNGPDGDIDFPLDEKLLPMDYAVLLETLLLESYDPTNGIASGGDIIRRIDPRDIIMPEP